MRRFLCALLVAAGLTTAVSAQSPTPAAFTARFAEALQAAMPSVKVRVVRDLQLSVERAVGTAATVSLRNNYKDYTPDPKWFEAVIKAYAAALAKPGPAKLAANVDVARIVPVIKDRAWLAELQDRFKKQDASQQPLFDDLNDELVVVYAEDFDNKTRYLGASEVVGLERSKLRELAVDNLMRLMPRVEMRQLTEGAFMIASHEDYGASLILIDRMWSSDQIKVNGDVVVAVPTKDMILVTGSRDRKNLNAVRTLARDLAKENNGLIDTLFVYRKGRFVKFGRN